MDGHHKMIQKNKSLIAGLLLLAALVLVLQNISAAETTYCAETTMPLPNVGVLHCIDGLSINEVDQRYLYSATTCEATEYCKIGTCVNTIAGTCSTAPQATCDSSKGGVFYTAEISNVPACQNGCCLIGEQASFTTDAGCAVLASNAGVPKNFDATVNDESTCISMARPQAKGACVYETSDGRTCDFTTRQECSDKTVETTFYEDFLCTNVDLKTNCVRTSPAQTKCIKESDKVFFKDSCGNTANVYDATKVDDINYWNYIADSTVGTANGVTVSAGDGKGNIGSATYGNCNYYLGSTCMQYDRNVDPSAPGLIGDNICRNVNCVSGTFSDLFKSTYGRTPYNGETWCGEVEKSSIKLTTGNSGISSLDFSGYDKTGNFPGSTEVLFICANGRVTTEVSAQYRNKICSQGTDGNGNIGAGWSVNRWQYCYYYNTSEDCLNNETGDCKWVTGASILKDASGNPLVYNSAEDALVSSSGVDETKPEASCVPKYPPGFDPSTTGNSTDLSSQTICGLGSRVCYVNYSKGILGDWYVTNNAGDLLAGKITCLSNNGTLIPEWGGNLTNLCMSLGDCGISVNYAGRSGSNAENDLFDIIVGNTSGTNV